MVKLMSLDDFFGFCLGNVPLETKKSGSSILKSDKVTATYLLLFTALDENFFSDIIHKFDY